MADDRHQSLFTRFAKATAQASGRPATFALALATIIAWAATGPFFGFSDTWQLVVNTSTTIVTFLMVFLIQNTQNRESVAVQIKLNELLRASLGAHNALLDLEELDDPDLAEMRAKYFRLAAESRRRLKRGDADTECPELAGAGEPSPAADDDGHRRAPSVSSPE